MAAKDEWTNCLKMVNGPPQEHDGLHLPGIASGCSASNFQGDAIRGTLVHLETKK